MAEHTGIEWCDHTFNPWIGCTPISDGCRECYAKALVKNRMGKDFGVLWRTSGPNWRKPLKWNADAITAGVRRRVFVASLADVFDRQAEEQWRNDFWELVNLCHGLDWLLLTKRPHNIAKMLPNQSYYQPWPWANVWLGTSVENQVEADRRIPRLLEIPAAIHFLSCEPLLGPIDLMHVEVPKFTLEDHKIDWKFDALSATSYCEFQDDFGFWQGGDGPCDRNRIAWVIAGGESGPGARPMHPDWARSLRDQCAGAGVPFFFKQWGEWIVPYDGARACRVCGCTDNFACENRCFWVQRNLCSNCRGLPTPPGDRAVKFYRAGKRRAGAILDGIEHREFPT